MSSDLNQKLVTDLNLILIEYPSIKILSKRVRSMEDQMYYVVTRWSEYARTKRDFVSKFNLTDAQLPRSIAALNSEQEKYLRERIQHYSDIGAGYRHLKGNAIDVSVREIVDWRVKEKIKNRIEKMGYNIILEKPPKYNVTIEQATTFHVELK